MTYVAHPDVSAVGRCFVAAGLVMLAAPSYNACVRCSETCLWCPRNLLCLRLDDRPRPVGRSTQEIIAMFRSRRNRVQEAGLCCFHVVGSSPDLSRVSPPVPRWSQSSLFHDSVPVNFCTRSSSRMPKPRANARNPSHSLVTILDRRRIVARKSPPPLIPPCSSPQARTGGAWPASGRPVG
jgi:hypothetical protein